MHTFPTKSLNENLVVALVGIRIEFLLEYSIITFMQMINWFTAIFHYNLYVNKIDNIMEILWKF
jgi:hypothetical protein